MSLVLCQQMKIVYTKFDHKRASSPQFCYFWRILQLLLWIWSTCVKIKKNIKNFLNITLYCNYNSLNYLFQTIFLFIIKQLSGLKDPKDPAFKRYFYLLENLAYVKSFNMCFDLEDCQEIFCNLFSLMFKIVK